MVATCGETTVKALLVLEITDLVKFFNVGKSMNDVQIADTIGLILDHYPRLRPDDIKLCFKKSKAGMYGPLYDRLDGQVILGWIFAYTQSKEEFVEHNNFIAHKKTKQLDETPVTPEMKKSGIELLKKSYVEPLREEEKEKRSKRALEFSRQVSIELNMEHVWMQLFDKIQYRQNTQLANGTRYITRYGKRMTTTDFLHHKVAQRLYVIELLEIRKRTGIIKLTPNT